MICAWLGTGIIKLPNFGGMKQCKSLVNLMDFTLIVHCLGWFHIMTLWDTPLKLNELIPKNAAICHIREAGDKNVPYSQPFFLANPFINFRGGVPLS